MNKSFINKRKKNFFNINKYTIFLTLVIIFFAIYCFSKYKDISRTSIYYIEKYSIEYQYSFKNIEISNLKYLRDEEISGYLSPYIGKSIFLVPIKKISKDILRNKWIHSINIKSDYKNTLRLFVVEESPLGIYNNNNQKILFSQNLVFLEILTKQDQYSNLITFFGRNSIVNSKKLMLSLDKNFKDNINEAIFIENRRWNLKLKNFILLKLPENDLSEAIGNYKKIYSNFSNKDLKGIESIDLRIKNKAIIKYKN